MQRRALILWLIVLAVVGVNPIYAHANLVRSTPISNARLDDAPQEIRLFFSEPLESKFSHIELRDIQGDILDLPDAEIDANDNQQLFVPLTTLSDGVYTISWRVVSQTDGHLTQGSFPITIGTTAQMPQSTAPTTDNTIPAISVIIRWFNLLSLGLLVGGIAFLKFIWLPINTGQSPDITQRLKLGIWIGWFSVEISTLLIAFLQTTIVTGTTSVPDINQLAQVIVGTRFGMLWLIRCGLLLVIGLILLKNNLQRSSVLWVMLTLSSGLLLTQSLFSHASGASDAIPAVIADWLHLLGMSLWIGGLIQLGSILTKLRQINGMISRTLIYFSNMARIAVAMLILTGAYATFIHVGSVDALLTTAYGQALVIKLILFLPLLLIGAVNLMITTRQLRKDSTIWTEQLQYLTMTEVILAICILLAVGVMTAIAPARIQFESRNNTEQPQTVPSSFFEMKIDDHMMIHFSIEPGIVGENTFYVDLYDEETGTIIDNASLIRLRFQDKDALLATSELRPTLSNEGRYMVSGSNIGVAGNWQIRVTIQRPDEYDTVVDFTPHIEAPLPAPTAVPDFSPEPDFDSRWLALLLAGTAIIVVNVMLFGKQSKPRLHAEIVVMSSVCGMLILGSGMNLLLSSNSEDTTNNITGNSIISMAVNSLIERPWLVTAEGEILRPTENDQWESLSTDIKANAIYLDGADKLWVASKEGFYRYEGDEWEQISSLPTTDVTMTHGYAYALGNREVPRIGAGGIETDKRVLEIPDPDGLAEQFEMLGNHTHVLLDGDQLYLTSSLGLGWESINAPEPMSHITIDADGNLLASSNTAIWRWLWSNTTWTKLTALPTDDPIDDMMVFQGQLYVAADGKLFKPSRGEWSQVELENRGYISDIAFQYPDRLWVLDKQNSQLFYKYSVGVWNILDVIINPQT